MKAKMCSFLIDNCEHKNIVATSHNQYKDVLLNNECLRHSMNRIQSKYHRIETYKSTKFHCLVLMTKYIS